MFTWTAAHSATLSDVIRRGQTTGCDALTPEECIIYLVADADTSIAMQGFVGYFDMYCGSMAPRAADAMETIGAHESARLLREAINSFPDGEYPDDTDYRREVMATTDPGWEESVTALSRKYLLRPDRLGDLFNEFFEKYVTAGRG